MWAGAANNAAAITALVKGGADLDARTPKGLDALLFAVRAGRREATEALLDAGADIAGTMTTGENALELALVNTHWDIADTLLDRGADPNQADAGYTGLHRIAVQRQIIRGVVYSEEAAIPIGSLDILMDLVRKMIAGGMDVNARMAKDRLKEQRFVNMRDVLFRVGATAFLLAAKEADLELMELLLEAGADPTIPTLDGTTPLMVAAGLYSDTGSLGRFHQRGWAGDLLTAVKMCVDLGNDINAVNRVGDTALHGAATGVRPRSRSTSRPAVPSSMPWTPVGSRPCRSLLQDGHHPIAADGQVPAHPDDVAGSPHRCGPAGHGQALSVLLPDPVRPVRGREGTRTQTGRGIRAPQRAEGSGPRPSIVGAGLVPARRALRARFENATHSRVECRGRTGSRARATPTRPPGRAVAPTSRCPIPSPRPG